MCISPSKQSQRQSNNIQTLLFLVNAELVLLQMTFPKERRAAAGDRTVERGLFAALVIQMPRQSVLVLESTATVAHKRLHRDRRVTPLSIGYHKRIIIYVNINRRTNKSDTLISIFG